MSSIRAQGGTLFFDFRYRGQRCREYTKLPDTPANRRRMEKVLEKIEQAIAEGRFDYATFFPGSRMAEKVAVGAETPPPLPRSSIDTHLVPFFGIRPVGEITKSELLQFRAEIAQCKGRGENETLSANNALQWRGLYLESRWSPPQGATGRSSSRAWSCGN